MICPEHDMVMQQLPDENNTKGYSNVCHICVLVYLVHISLKNHAEDNEVCHSVDVIIKTMRGGLR